MTYTSNTESQSLMSRGKARMRSSVDQNNERYDSSEHGIEKPAAVRFYDECYRQGIPGTEVHAAVVESHGWRDRWLNDRQAGAKNPSPGDSSDESSAVNNERKRDRLEYFKHVDSSLSSEVSSSSRSAFQQRPKRLHSSRDESGIVSDDENDVWERPRPVQAVTAAPILRPIAVRIARPLPPLFLDDPIEHSIDLNSGREEPSPLQLSPPQMTQQPIAEEQSFVNVVEDEEEVEAAPICEIPKQPTDAIPSLEAAKSAVLHALAISGGDETSPILEAALKPLLLHYHANHMDARAGEALEGMWLTLTKPSWAGNLGENHGGDTMYTLGRMSFGMFKPTQMVCSLQGNFNTIEPVLSLEECVAPKSLMEEVHQDGAVLRTYDIVTAFTIEPYQPDFNGSPNQDVHRPIRGIMTTQGYALPDPEVPNRLSIWFTGGVLQPNDNDQDQQDWKKLFCSKKLPERTFGEKAMVLAAKMLMGATLGEIQEDGTMTYEFTRPLGGHGMAYDDVLYLDHGLRIVRGHKGSLFVFVRVPDHTHDP